MLHAVLRVIGNIIRNAFIFVLSLFCCRCRAKVLRMFGLDKSSNDQSNNKPLEGVYVQPSFGAAWESWEPALPAPKNKALLAKQNSKPEDAEPEPDYFSDMTPRVTKPPLIVKKSRESSRPDSSKLAIKEDLFPPLSAELTEWQDPSTQNSTEGWQTVDVLSTPDQSYSSQKYPSRAKGRPR